MKKLTKNYQAWQKFKVVVCNDTSVLRTASYVNFKEFADGSQSIKK